MFPTALANPCLDPAWRSSSAKCRNFFALMSYGRFTPNPPADVVSCCIELAFERINETRSEILLKEVFILRHYVLEHSLKKNQFSSAERVLIGGFHSYPVSESSFVSRIWLESEIMMRACV